MKHLNAILLFAVAVAPAWPQASTSVVHGSVRDVTDAVIPVAAVSLTGVDTNVERKTTTNSAGLYVFPGVVPGPGGIAGGGRTASSSLIAREASPARGNSQCGREFATRFSPSWKVPPPKFMIRPRGRSSSLR